ncbi:UDP-N-acetylglucosamine pyrophosphorylase-like [Teratosphaeria destructans]|uniref:UDP-N-acetylglucosamine diphosphorylase n=1 Tax=Teratosphaeria destructans TaxID=418781 RepID=A0A9W7SYD3_9PEZI|nr:UDP-N-acetylglucosamine pyrophosphorylase-like [Teratosphaeria destructans]
MTDAIREGVSNLLSALSLGGKKNEGDAPPPPPSDAEYKELKEKYEKANQGHLFEYWDSLKDAEKGILYSQLEPIDPEHINKIADRAINPPKPTTEEEKPKLEQLPGSATTSTIDSKQGDLEKWYKDGLHLIADNKVGVVLMAGGQGTRLGSSAPKGCYDIGLPSKKSLFQLQAERIWRLQHLAEKQHEKEDVVVPWYIMTSGPTRKPTQQFFEDNKYFGLNRNNVIFFEQGVLPCISMDGKILLESKGKVAVAPDGNGGLYQALISSGVVQDMEKRGVKHIHAYCVDNCLVRVADPTFIGFSAEKDVDIATKVVRKRNAKESVGLILQKNGKPDVVEYSEIDAATAEAKDSKDSNLLKFRAANIVNHYYSFRFLQSIPDWSHKLPHHLAKKKIPSIPLDSKTGEQVKPEKPNGIKLEQFVFDCFPFLPMDKFACMEVKREDEFSPLKNAPGTGEDDPGTSRKDIMEQGRRFLTEAGATVTSEGEDSGVEVSPKISYGGEGLEFLKGREIKAPAVIEKEQNA